MQNFLSETLPFWNELTNLQQQLILDNIQTKKITKNTIINNIALKWEGLKIVKKGLVRAFINSDKGQEITLFRLNDNEICAFSIICIVKHLDINISIEAEKDTDVITIPFNIFTEIMNKNAEVEKFASNIISSRLIDIISVLTNYTFMTVEQRLVDSLIRYSSMSNSNNICITHEKLAKDIGTVREVVSRSLKQLQIKNIVKLNRGEIIILDIDRLKGFYR